MRLLIWTFAALIVVSSVLDGSAQPQPSYKVLKKIPVGGQGGWDYLTVDPQSRRLYITRGTHVMVMDVEKETIVGDIENTAGVHGVALAPKLNRGFTSNGGDSTVTIFDMETLKEIGRAKVGARPDAILYDPASNRVFTFNAGSKDATAVAADTGTVAGTVKLGGRPEFAVANNNGMVYVNIEDKDEVVAFDAKELTVKNRWPLAPGKAPAGLAMDRSKRRLFSTCQNEKMVILEADTGKVLATPAIGKGTDAAIFDPTTGLAFSSNRDGTLTIVEERDGSYQVVANVKTQYGAKTMAMDPRTHNIYLATAEFKKAPAGKRPSPVPETFTILVVGR